MSSLEEKRAHEQKTMAQIIRLYCHKKHHTNGALCTHCQALHNYAIERIQHCPHMAVKTFCSVCPSHCYAPEQREAIRQIMRYSGPRMLLYAPRLTLQHILLQWRTKHTKKD